MGQSSRINSGFDRFRSEYQSPVDHRPYTAAGAFDKLGLLVLLALFTGAIGYATNSMALFVVGLFGGLVFSLIGFFKPATAKYVAPLYALCEGLALGALTSAYATGSNGIAPLAIVFTGGIFIAALVVFRSGLVKVTPRFVSMVMVGLLGFMVVLLAAWLGLFPGLSSQAGLLVFGVVGAALGVAMLFIDFNAVDMAEQRALPADAEWFGALMLMTSLVFIYINVLRILGSRGRR